jgi:hypothetical protein
VEPRLQIGLMLVALGIILALTGAIVLFADKIPYLGRLPGDITVQGQGWSFYFPLMTGIVISLFLTIILNLIFRR